MKKEIKIKDLIITVEEVGDQDYVSLTDIAKQSERRSGDEFVTGCVIVKL